MEVSSKHQMVVFLLCVLAGAACGMLFDVQRCIRKVFSAGKFRTTVEDLFFGAVCTLITILIGYLYNRGEIRYYQILGAACGMFFYAAMLSRVTIKLLSSAAVTIRRFVLVPIAKMLKILIAPFVQLYIVLKGFFGKIKRKILKLSAMFCNKRKKFKKRMKML